MKKRQLLCKDNLITIAFAVRQALWPSILWRRQFS